jgi:hypothetical protein
MEKWVKIAQKITVFITIISYALLAVYGFGMSTPAAPLHQYQDTIDFYLNIQPYNDMIVYFSIVGVILALLYRVFRNNVRQVYYVSNWIWSAAYVVFTIFVAIQTMLYVSFYQQLYLAVDFETINAYFASTTPGVYVNPNTPVFLLGYLEVALLLFSTLPVLFITIFKAVSQIKEAKSATPKLQEEKQ